MQPIGNGGSNSGNSGRWINVDVCNRAGRGKVYVAVGYQGAAGWRGKGWAHVDDGACVRVLNGVSYSVTNPKVYLYATTNTYSPFSGTWWATNERARFCVDGTNGFELNQAPINCESGTRFFQELGAVYVQNGQYTWTLNP